MRILENKEKKSILLKINNEKVYVALSNKEEEQWLKNVVHLLSNELDKAAYQIDATNYLFIEKNGEELVINRKEFEEESQAGVQLDIFFEGHALEIFEDAKVPAVKSIDKRIVVAVVIVLIAIFSYSLFNLVWPEKQPIRIINAAPSVPANLNDNEKERLKVIGSRLVAEKVARVISSVRADTYARISVMTVQRTEGPQSVSYILTTGKEYQYPPIGSTSVNQGVWRKTEVETVALSRNNIAVVENRDFDRCAVEMLEDGFYVKSRDDRCVELVYEGDAGKTIGLYNSVKDCNVSLNSLDINLGKGKIDVAFCQQ